jgi:hypothetical protein
MFIGVVGVLGAGVRVVRAAGRDAVPAVQPELERQAHAADSASSEQRDRQGPTGRGKAGRGRGSGGRGRGRGASSQARADSGGLVARESDHVHRLPVGPLDRPGYIRGRLDLDVATAAQIDSLPGVTALMARRIASDRARRGPFLNANGLQRVSGVGKRFLQQIDTLVTYSGTFAVASPTDTVIKSRKKSRP